MSSLKQCLMMFRESIFRMYNSPIRRIVPRTRFLALSGSSLTSPSLFAESVYAVNSCWHLLKITLRKSCTACFLACSGGMSSEVLISKEGNPLYNSRQNWAYVLQKTDSAIDFSKVNVAAMSNLVLLFMSRSCSDPLTTFSTITWKFSGQILFRTRRKAFSVFSFSSVFSNFSAPTRKRFSDFFNFSTGGKNFGSLPPLRRFPWRSRRPSFREFLSFLPPR
mmetsp:Transcript_9133/g.12745  ORF Transcript_9133/g.12745 Transcript_9133/m.12745 type:complete len:221 (-) Transcript_9133:709-1371(-)